MKLTKENVESLRQPFIEVWATIGPDVLRDEPDISNQGIIEMCWDLDRLKLLVSDVSRGNAAEDLVEELINTMGYQKTAAFLAAEFNLANSRVSIDLIPNETAV